jgi:hypothetical protein
MSTQLDLTRAEALIFRERDTLTVKSGGSLVVASGGTLTVADGTATLTGATLTGATLLDAELDGAILTDYSETVNALGAGGGTRTVDLLLGNVVTVTVDTSTNTFVFDNPPPTGFRGNLTLVITDGGSQTVNWPNSVVWSSAGEPVLTVSGVDVLTFFTVDGGTTWYGFVAGQDMQ